MAVQGIATPWPYIKGVPKSGIVIFLKLYSWETKSDKGIQYCHSTAPCCQMSEIEWNITFQTGSRTGHLRRCCQSLRCRLRCFQLKVFFLAAGLLVAMAMSGRHPHRPSVLLLAVQKKRQHGRVKHTDTHTLTHTLTNTYQSKLGNTLQKIHIIRTKNRKEYSHIHSWTFIITWIHKTHTHTFPTAPS